MLGLSWTVKRGHSLRPLPRAKRVRRVLRFPAGLFSEDAASGKCYQSPLSGTLRSDHLQTVRAYSHRIRLGVFVESIRKSVRDREKRPTRIQSAFKCIIFDYLAAHHGDAAAFNNATTSVSSMKFPAIIASSDLLRFERIGGGEPRK